MGLNAERKNYVIGRGDVFFAVADPVTGVLGGERLVGNTPAMNIGVQSQTLKHYGSGRGMRVQDREVPIQMDYSGSFKCDDINPKNLAFMLAGAASVAAITSATGATDSFVGVEQGLFYQLGKTTGNPAGAQLVSNVVVKVATVTKVLGTDYTLDAALGRISIIEGGSITSGATVDVTYDRAAASQERVISGSTVGSGSLRFIAYNPEGDNTDYLIRDVKLSADGDFALKADNNWQEMGFKLSISTPADGAAILANGRAWAP